MDYEQNTMSQLIAHLYLYVDWCEYARVCGCIVGSADCDHYLDCDGVKICL